MKLVKNMGLSTIYQLMAVIVPLITAPYISRVLGAEGIGINSYTSAILSYFTLFAALGIVSYGNREIAYHQNNIKERSKIFWELELIQATSTLISIVLFLIFLAFQSEFQIYFLLQGVSLLTVVANISWFFMGLENFKIIVYRNTIINIAVVFLTFILVKDAGDLWIYILLVTCSSLFANLSVWPFLKREICKVSFKELQLKRHLVPMLTLLLPQVVTTAYVSLNKTMLGWFDINSAGYFNQADMIIRVAFTAVSSFAGAFLPRLSNLFSEQKFEEGKKLILQSLQLMYTFSFLAIAGIIGVSDNFAVFYFGKEFAIVGSLMAVEAGVILLFGIAVVLRSQYLLAMRRMNEITISSMLALAVNIVLNFILIPFYGAMGATIAVLITEVVVTGYLIWSVRNDFEYREMFQEIWKYLLAGVLTLLLIYSLNQCMSATIFNFAVQATVGCVVYALLLSISKPPIVKVVAPFLKKMLKKQ